MLDQQHANDDSTRIVEEMGVWAGTVRIDVAVINGELAGFELKSDRDTLQRLPYQRVIYGKVFDRMTLVVGERHYAKSVAMIPEWWGCAVAFIQGGGVTIREERAAGHNPKRDAFVVAQMLWKTEAIAVLKRRGMARGWCKRSAADISRRLAGELPLAELSKHVREALKERVRLGQLGPREFDVPVDRVRDPRCRIPGALTRIGGDVGELSICPAMPQGNVARISHDRGSMPAILNGAGDRSWAGLADASQDLKR